MFAPEEQQMEICLLKSNLDEIENNLIVQYSALPELDAEIDQKYRATLEALRVARYLNSEIDRSKQENLRLTAKRMQLKQQCENITSELERARQVRSEIKDELKDEETSTELEIRKYEDSLREKSDRFRRTRGYYNENEICGETSKTNESISKLEMQADDLQNHIDSLKQELISLHPNVPDNLVEILGKEINEKMNNLHKTFEELQKEKNFLLG